MCSSFAVRIPCSGYVTSNHHWWPMTSTCMAPGSHSVSSKTVWTVGTAITARIRAGITVQTTSSLALPWICLGSWRPGRSRKKIAATMMAPWTSTKTAVAIQNTGQNSPSMVRAKGPCGSRELRGASSTVGSISWHAVSSSASATTPRSRSDRSRDPIGPHHTVWPGGSPTHPGPPRGPGPAQLPRAVRACSSSSMPTVPSKRAVMVPAASVTNTHGSEGSAHVATASTGTRSSELSASRFS